MKLLQERIDEIFQFCSSSTGIGTADFRSICKTFWMCLNNSVTFVDLAGVFTVSMPPIGMEILTADLFDDFLKAFSLVKYPSENSHVEKLVDEIRNTKPLRIPADSPLFPSIIDRNVIRVLLKYDHPIKKAYSNFCGQSVRVGGRLNWEEAKSMSIGMEVFFPQSLIIYCSLKLYASFQADGFISFAGAYSLIPKYLSAPVRLFFNNWNYHYSILIYSQRILAM